MKHFLILLVTLCVLTTTAKTQNQKKLLYKDATYEAEIRTVQLYPNRNENWNVLSPPVAQLGQMNLILEFDDLVKDTESYRAKIIHCNQNWSKSRLSNIDFLYDYNEFNITNDQFSVDTKIAYVHYTFQLPQVKIPGNYLLVVYRGNNESDIVLSKRFMVYTNKVSINVTSPLRGFTSSNRFNQQLNFIINYENYDIINPLETVKVTLRQNERWDNAITKLKPSFIRDHVKELEYRFFNYENSFFAGNEYRFFDMRSLRNPGQGVQKVDWSTYPLTVDLMLDGPRIYQPYTSVEDLNGDFYVVNVDAGNGDTYSDYVSTRFHLKSQQPISGDVFVVGKMNNWESTTDNKMAYDKKNRSYEAELILKQGWYDYKYMVKNDTLNTNHLEGNHFQTENNYEIFVYYRPMNMRADLLVGYGFYEMNKIE